ncbi:RNA-binding protein 42-like isoform X2 [Artemia franciscana]|uniref:RNA-binding protein 42-like isoform X2 n=1 Tax=Artemia franciscana TaxID=6661 RepID=UPI0032DA9BDD
MTPMHSEKTRQMQDEMERFEAEILGQAGTPIRPTGMPMFPGNQAQRMMAPPPPPPGGLQLLEHRRPAPPPPPRNMFLPSQITRPRTLAPPPPPPSGFIRVPIRMGPVFQPAMGAPNVGSFDPAMNQMYNQGQVFPGQVTSLQSTVPSIREAPEPPPENEATKLVISAAPQRYDKSKENTESNVNTNVEKKVETIEPREELSLEGKPIAQTSGSGATKSDKKSKKKEKKIIRVAGGQVWEDPNLQDWDPNDFRIFCGDLGNDVTDEVLARVFGRYPSFQRAKVIRDKRSNKTKGYGFVSFKDPQDFIRAMKEVNVMRMKDDRLPKLSFPAHRLGLNRKQVVLSWGGAMS